MENVSTLDQAPRSGGGAVLAYGPIPPRIADRHDSRSLSTLAKEPRSGGGQDLRKASRRGWSVSGTAAPVNLLIFLVGIALAIVAARPLSPPMVRRAATLGVIGVMLAAPLVSSSTSILFDALTAMCIAYGWNIIGGFTG